VSYRYHTARFMRVAELRGRGEVLVPEDRWPGQPWREVRQTEIRIGYGAGAAGSALEAAGCRRVLVERAGGAGRPVLVEAVRAVGEAARDGAAVLVVVGIGDLGRNSAELAAVAEELRAAGAGLEVLTGALAGEHRAGSVFFEVMGAAAGLDREDARRRIVAGQRAAAERGRRSGRPRVLDDELVAEARRLRDAGVPVPEIAARLVIKGGRNAGSHPSVASIYRALADTDASTTSAFRGGAAGVPVPERQGG
jgi:DNA invertase Pin-like site-specific DNA recombinase